MPSMERRRMPRCALRVDSWVSMENGRQYGGLVTDLSKSGCRVHSFIPLIDGMPLQLQLRLPGDVAHCESDVRLYDGHTRRSSV